MNLPLEGTGIELVLARARAVQALEKRFGWLRNELYALGGNVQSLEPHKQKLWHVRDKAVARLNRIPNERDVYKRVRLYKRLAKDLDNRFL